MGQLYIDLPSEARRHLIAQIGMMHPVPMEFRAQLLNRGDGTEGLIDRLGEELLLEVEQVAWSEHAQICVLTNISKTSESLYFPMSVSVNAPVGAVSELAQKVAGEDGSLHYYEPSSSHPIRLLGIVKYESEAVVTEEAVA